MLEMDTLLLTASLRWTAFSPSLQASLALCNHGGADLCDGYFDDHVIECRLHQGAFDVRDGRPVAAPATRAMRVLEVRVSERKVQMRI